MQEIVLGVGGWRALEALGHDVDVCHLNEGHAALATIERARTSPRRSDCDFFTALWATRGGNVFTTHTPVAAAFDTFPLALLRSTASATRVAAASCPAAHRARTQESRRSSTSRSTWPTSRPGPARA
jgi:glucan phosphorylase